MTTAGRHAETESGIEARSALISEMPVSERAIELAGVETAVLEGGEGPPLVMLHGPGEHAAKWVRVAPALAHSHRIVMPDLPGHGRSEDTGGPLEPERVIDWLDELIEATCDGPPVLLGQIIGGAIAARYAAARPGRVERLVLCDSLGLAPFDPAPEFGAALAAHLAAPTGETHDALWDHCAHDLGRLRDGMGRTWDALRAYNLDRAGDAALAETQGALMGHFGVPAIPAGELRRIAVPVALIWGRHDLATRVSVAREASERLGWPLFVIDGAADDPPVERPGEFVQTLRAALDVDRLSERIEGRVLLHGDDGFDDAIRPWNAMAARTPALVLQPESATDVAAAIDFARERGIPVGARGGGHHIAGVGVTDAGLTLDMSSMSAIEVDPDRRLARVGPGCLLGDVDRATQEHGLATVLGFLSEVGVAGLTLGGGLGYLTRRFGWTVDNLEAVEVVTADGRIRTASRDENEDLFWGLRGAGANLGVVTSFTFRLHEVGPTVYGGLVAWPFEDAERVYSEYRALTEEAPRDLSVWMIVLNAPPAPFVPPEWHGRRVCAMSVCHSGEEERREEALARLRGLGEPVFDLLREQPYAEIQSQLDDTEPKGHHYYWRNEFATGLSDELIDTMRGLADDCPIPRGQVGILHLGGALNDHDPDDGAVGNRDARYALGVLGAWEPGEPREEEFSAWVRAAGERIHRHSSGNYVNFQTADEGDERIAEVYGENYERLRELKRRYDPENLFRSNRNVSPG